ncbi:amidohydrolase [Ilumatobacter coccineus]|uniref:Peptidase M20 family protein n=1 Tax=Ilumatobacter coccineus (strain NBRC 103263 / KCTC 29153 / YM16-304) TaxID=1313172 RepID=A0A6C7EFM9_ILUCY|nr:amidohydrolase [Ilumatobacter coccineus]BAN03825.1 peptidase M20 family protein [Ilumatobacter coccineus YM16-304]
MTVTIDHDRIAQQIDSMLPPLREVYEDLHAHPELSFQEHRTAGVVADRLDALGFEVTTGVGGTGVVATLGDDGPPVLLRADIDALPVEEATGLSYASTQRGMTAAGDDVPIAHACGHDMHVTWMLGVAELLASDRSAWGGRAMLVFQPAEEVGGGAAAMCDDGLFERFGTPVVGLGQHVAPAPAGWLLSRSGVAMAASDSLKVVLHGRGGHGSSPESTVDPVVLAASTIMRLQSIVSRELAARESAVVTVGTVHAGTKENIIADRAELGLNVRTFDAKVRDRVLAAIERIVHGEAHAAGCPSSPEIEPISRFPALHNDPTTTTTVEAAFRSHFAADRVLEAPPASASEDFGLLGERGGFPSSFWFVGGADHATFFDALAANRVNEDIPANHSPLYAPIQNPTMAAGIEAMYVAARQWLTA